MTIRADIRRLETESFKVAHCRLPPWKDLELVSVSDPSSIGVAFTAQHKARVRKGSGPTATRDVPAGSVGLGGLEPITWISVQAASDIIEITGSEELRADTAQAMGAPQHAALGDIHSWSDPVILVIAARLRAGLRQWTPLAASEAETLVQAAYAHVLRLKFGGRDKSVGALDARRLARVNALLHAEPARDVSLSEMAAAANLSPFHFARSFSRATGIPPHRYLTQLRLERAAQALAHRGATVETAAAAAGFANLHHFRRLFRAQFGVQPSALRKAKRAGPEPALPSTLYEPDAL